MFRLDIFQLENIKVGATKFGRVKLDLYQVADLSAKGLGKILIEGFNLLGNKGEYANLNRFSLSDLRFPPLEALLNLKNAGNSNDMQAILKAIPTLESVVSKGFEVRIPDIGEISFAESSTKMSDFIGPIPTNIAILLNELKMPVSLLNNESGQILAGMGYDQLQISYGINALWDEASKILSLDTNLELDNGGVLDAKLSIGGVPRMVFEDP